MCSALKFLTRYAQEGDEFLDSIVTRWNMGFSPHFWIQSPFALRNRMTESTSHLAGLWNGAAISNTSHSNKADSTTVKWAQVKDQSRWQCCHNKHKKFLYRPTRDVSLLSWPASYVIMLMLVISKYFRSHFLSFFGRQNMKHKFNSIGLQWWCMTDNLRFLYFVRHLKPYNLCLKLFEKHNVSEAGSASVFM
jgi:hypothetical protein